MESEKNLSINIHDYGYQCKSDGLDKYGTIITVNGVEMPYHNQDTGTILEQVLEHLGYKVTITYTDDFIGD